MKMLAAVALTLAAAFAVQFAAAADNQDRPVGVEERYWISITERLGFVIEHNKKPGPRFAPAALIPPPENVSAELMPPEKGYFVIKTPTGWRRLVVSSPSDLAG